MIRWDGGLEDLATILPTFSDGELVRTYQRTDGEVDNPVAELLLAEIQRRNLDL